MQTVEARPARPATAPSGGELAGILRDCAEWVPGSLERLKGYYAARLRVRVGPALADVALAEPSLQSALADAWAEAGRVRPVARIGRAVAVRARSPGPRQFPPQGVGGVGTPR